MTSKERYRFPQCYPVLLIPIKAEQLLPETRKSQDKIYIYHSLNALNWKDTSRKRKKVFEEWMKGRGKFLSSEQIFQNLRAVMRRCSCYTVQMQKQTKHTITHSHINDKSPLWQCKSTPCRCKKKKKKKFFLALSQCWRNAEYQWDHFFYWKGRTNTDVNHTVVGMAKYFDSVVWNLSHVKNMSCQSNAIGLMLVVAENVTRTQAKKKWRDINCREIES